MCFRGILYRNCALIHAHSDVEQMEYVKLITPRATMLLPELVDMQRAYREYQLSACGNELMCQAIARGNPNAIACLW